MIWLKLYKTLKNTMFHSPDNISCFLVKKKLALLIAQPLSLLFQCSLHEGILPDI